MQKYWTIIRGKLLHKKTESLIIGTTMMVSVLAFCASFGLLSGINKPYETMIREANGAHWLGFFDTRVHDVDELIAWFEANEKVESVGPPLSMYSARGEFLVSDRKIKRSLTLVERDQNPQMDKLTITRGANAKAHPGPGEIWIPNRLADGQDIKLGDILSLQSMTGKQAFVVTAFVVDPHFSTDAISPTRCWVAPGELALHFPLSDLTNCYLAVRLHDSNQASTLDRELLNSLGGNMAGFSMTHDMLQMAHGIFMRILAVGLLVVALLAQIIAIFIISATISSAVRADYRTIGIYKSMGFTPKQMRRLFVMRYLVLAIPFVPLGALLGIWITSLIFGPLERAVGLVNLSLPLAVPAVTAAVLVTLIVAVNAWWSSRAAAAIQPMQAIRFGAPPQTAKRRLSALAAFGRLPLAWVLGIRNLFLNTRRTVLFAIGMAFTVGVMIFSVNITSSFANIARNPGMFGDTDSDVNVNLTGRRFTIRYEQFQELMDNHPQVAHTIAYGSLSALTPGEDGQGGRQIRGMAYDGDMALAGLLTLEGRDPVADNEISVGINTAKRDGLARGDSYELFVEGFPVTFTVTGIFQTGMNLGDGFRITANALRQLDTTWRPRSMGITLVDGVTSDDFKTQLKERYQEAITVTTLLEDSEQLEQQLTGMRLSLAAFCALLLGISFVSIFNDTLLSLQEQTKTMGIFKALGLTPKQMRTSLATKALAGAGLGLLIGMPLSLVGLPILLNGLFSQLGMVDFPVSFNWTGTFLIVPGILLFTYVCAWLPARRVAQIRVRNLIHV